MNILTLCDPAYEVQAKLVGNLLTGGIVFLYKAALQHTILFFPLIIITIFTIPVFLAIIAWMIHPFIGVAAVLLMIGSWLNFNDKERLKKSGKWTAQDETNERLNDLEWSNIIMQKQMIDQLKIIANKK